MAWLGFGAAAGIWALLLIISIVWVALTPNK